MIDLNQLIIDGKYSCTEAQIQEIKQLLSSCPNNSPSLEQIWQMMDDVWDKLGCDNKNLNWQKISAFYNHPVWILNGLFIEQDELSIQHRKSIGNWINLNSEKIRYVVDYGGGMGTLAQIISESNQDICVDIYEPYPSQVAVTRLEKYPNINFVGELINCKYDCLVSTDVLEHVADPLSLLAQMIDAVGLNGYLIIANCFYPVIKCHLPRTFHFRYTFKIFAKLMGLKALENDQVLHGTIYVKEKEESLNWQQIRLLELCSKSIYPLLKMLHILKALPRGYAIIKKIAA